MKNKKGGKTTQEKLDELMDQALEFSKLVRQQTSALQKALEAFHSAKEAQEVPNKEIEERVIHLEEEPIPDYRDYKENTTTTVKFAKPGIVASDEDLE